MSQYLDVPVPDRRGGKRFFELAYGLRPPRKSEVPGLIYSRINNPNLQIFEERLAAWDGTEKGAVHSDLIAGVVTGPHDLPGGEGGALPGAPRRRRPSTRDLLVHLGVTSGLIRMSVGLEHLSDLKRDLEYALGDD